MDEDPWIDDLRLEIGGTKFIATSLPLGAVGDQFVIVKPPELVRRYLSLFDRERPRRIVELGIKDGGSTALIALAAEPDIFLAADLESDIPLLLAQLIDTHQLGDRVITRFGLDQGDRAALTGFVRSHMPEGEIDLVVDDASHILGPTRTSFEVLFPRLRPGGLYIVEDWSAECIAAGYLARALPGVDDFDDRLGAVNQVLHILNAPDHELPDGVVASMADVAAKPGDGDAAARDVFERIVGVAGHADLRALDQATLGRSRPLADLAVELMMISTTNPEIVSEVRTDGEWLTARRGTADLPPDTFRLDECWSDFFGYLS
jgi:predicted O-methyltransferase YrrM